MVQQLGFCGAVPPGWDERRNPYFYCDHFGDLPIVFPSIVIMSVIILTVVVLVVVVVVLVLLLVLVVVLVLVGCETCMGFEPRFSSLARIWHAEKTVVASKSRTLDLLCRRLQCR